MQPNPAALWIPIVAACVAAAVSFVVLVSLVGSEPLGHDEAVYLTKARSWIDNSPADQWAAYRPIAMSFFGWIFLHFGDAEKTVRMFGVLFGALAPAAVFALFFRMHGITVGLAAAALTVSSPLFLQQAPQFLNDMPSATILIALLAVLYAYFKSAGRSNVIYLAALLAALAFYVRYGVTTALVMIALVSYLVLLPRFLKKEGHDFSKLGKTILFAVLLFVPHILHALFTTKNPFGILKRAEEVAHRAYLGEGLVQYLKWLPAELAGWPLGIAMILGALAAVVLIFVRIPGDRRAAILWTGWIGLGAFVLTGLLVHAEARYVMFPVLLLAGSSLAALHLLLMHWSRGTANVALILIAVAALIYMALVSYPQSAAYFSGKAGDRYRLAYIEASHAISADSGGESCAIWAVGTYSPALSWYARCEVHIVSGRPAFQSEFSESNAAKRYSVVLTRITQPQLTNERAQEFKVALTEVFRRQAGGSRGDLIVYRIVEAQSEPAPPAATSTATTTPPQ